MIHVIEVGATVRYEGSIEALRGIYGWVVGPCPTEPERLHVRLRVQGRTVDLYRVRPSTMEEGENTNTSEVDRANQARAARALGRGWM